VYTTLGHGDDWELRGHHTKLLSGKASFVVKEYTRGQVPSPAYSAEYEGTVLLCRQKKPVFVTLNRGGATVRCCVGIKATPY